MDSQHFRVDFTHGISHSFDRAVLRGPAMPLDHHTIWVVCRLDLLAVLQEKLERHYAGWHRDIRR